MSAPLPPATPPAASLPQPTSAWGPALMRMRSSVAAFGFTALLVLVMRWDPIVFVPSLASFTAEILGVIIIHRLLKPTPFWMTLLWSLSMYVPMTIVLAYKIRSCPIPPHGHGH